MRNDLLMAIGFVLVLLVGYWFMHSRHRPITVDRPAAMVAATGNDNPMKQDLMAAAGIKTAVAEFYANRGKMPQDNAEAGLPPPSEYRGQTLRSATVNPDGSIDFEFDENSGRDGGHVRLVADLSHANAMGMQWHCESADYSDIGSAIPNCAYVQR
jgi:Pilin (bacterial filament)